MGREENLGNKIFNDFVFHVSVTANSNVFCSGYSILHWFALLATVLNHLQKTLFSYSLHPIDFNNYMVK